ncbi:MAG: DegT/DnrJ/EryC1/StrS family aminotransferase [Alphaproteobacteria bacterium]|nr:DegT/DnrJ/EryC1/StrS family aminotransferase [Alphaproteobacteria bacterium]
MADCTIPQITPWIGDEEIAAVSQTLADNWITEGPRAEEFTSALNQLMGVEYGVFAPNGTLALALALMALEIGPGDQVLVPDTTFVGSATAVQMVGATPVFVEVDPLTFQIDTEHAEALVNEHTRAVMPVHLYGMCCDMDRVMAFAKKHGLKVVEDACQAVGVSFNGRHAGNFGDAGCFSFFADKTITTGEGGYVICNDSGVHEKLLLLRNQGRIDRGSFIHPAVGYNFRITDMQAALGLVQLKKLDEIKRRKLEILDWYREELDGCQDVSFLPLQENSTYVPFRTVLFHDHAHDLMTHLEAAGIQSRSFFHPLHKQPCFASLDKSQGGPLDLDDARYPNAVRGYETGLCLPIFPTLRREQVAEIGTAIRGFSA